MGRDVRVCHQFLHYAQAQKYMSVWESRTKLTQFSHKHRFGGSCIVQKMYDTNQIPLGHSAFCPRLPLWNEGVLGSFLLWNEVEGRICTKIRTNSPSLSYFSFNVTLCPLQKDICGSKFCCQIFQSQLTHKICVSCPTLKFDLSIEQSKNLN